MGSDALNTFSALPECASNLADTNVALGIIKLVCNLVRMVVVRKPTRSTLPSRPSNFSVSPTLNGLSAANTSELKKFFSGSCSAKANAMPPMPRPASMRSTEPSAPRIMTTHTLIMISANNFERRTPLAINNSSMARLSAAALSCVLNHVPA